MRNKIIGIFVCMLLITTCVIPVSSTISQNDEKKSSTLEIPDSHIIENIPYVNQGDSMYCWCATVTMTFQYYGINTSLFEMLFNSGIGYSVGYKIQWPCLGIPGYLFGQEAEERRFLADIYGVKYSYSDFYDTSISDDMKWQKYWTSVKENISQNIPVTTTIWMDELPYYENQPYEHYILLVGYNETNNTVCVHDSIATVYGTSTTSGAYIHIPIDSLKNAIKYLDYTYLVETFKDTSDEPLSKKDAFDLAHTRNINKMKGDANAFDKDCNRSGGPFYIFGVHAIKFIKHSYNMRNKIMLTISDTIRGTDTRLTLADYYWWMYVEKHNMSQYLMKNADLYPNAEFEAAMLEAEAGNWLLLYYKNIELWSIPIFKLPKQISVLKEIREIFDVIISIEKDIIANSPKTAFIRSPAEFEPVDELIVTWPKWRNIVFELKQQSYMIDLIEAAEDAVQIQININNPLQKIAIISQLQKAGVPIENITFSYIHTNLMWCRDYGPFFIEKNGELAIVDFNYYGWAARPKDNLYPTFYGIQNNIDYNFSSNFFLCLQGGNYMTDGQGRAMIADKPLHMGNNNRLLKNEEIKDRLKSALGLDEVYIFTSQKDDGTGHIDMFSKLLDENTVLVGRWEPNDVDYPILEDNAIYFSYLGLNVIRIPMLRDQNSKYHTIWTYTNSLIINGPHKKVVLVPQYNVSEDAVAISIYQQAMPEYEIRGIDCRTIIPGGGAIHCTTITRPFIE